MTGTKLTPTQRTTLAVISDAEDAGHPVHRFSTRRTVYNVSDGLKEAVVGRLIHAGLVDVRNSQGARPTFHLTPAGRSALDAALDAR